MEAALKLAGCVPPLKFLSRSHVLIAAFNARGSKTLRRGFEKGLPRARLTTFFRCHRALLLIDHLLRRRLGMFAFFNRILPTLRRLLLIQLHLLQRRVNGGLQLPNLISSVVLEPHPYDEEAQGNPQGPLEHIAEEVGFLFHGCGFYQLPKFSAVKDITGGCAPTPRVTAAAEFQIAHRSKNRAKPIHGFESTSLCMSRFFPVLLSPRAIASAFQSSPVG